MEGLPAKWKRKENLPDVTRSYHHLMVKELMQDFAATVLQVSDSPYEDGDETIANMPTGVFDHPNGYNQHHGPERFRIPECLFNPSLIKVSIYALDQQFFLSYNHFCEYFCQHRKQMLENISVFDEHCLKQCSVFSYRRSVRLSVRLSVRHIREPC